MLDRTLRRWDGDLLHTVADLSGYATGPLNDMTADRSGRVWIGNFGDDVPGAGAIGPTSIVSVSPDGKPIVAAEGLNFPNGMVLAHDEAVMLVAETFAARISAFDVEEDGTLTRRRTWADFGGHGDLWDVPTATRMQPVLPDGIALDAEGALWVGDAKGSGVLRVGEGGVLLDRIDTGELAVYAAGLGGARQQDLFLCCAPPLGTHDPTTSRAAVLLAATIPESGAGGDAMALAESPAEPGPHRATRIDVEGTQCIADPE
jgi:sugar lactone lactonase YvrE